VNVNHESVVAMMAVIGLYTAPMSSDDAGEHSEPIAVASYATAGEAEVAKAKLGAYGIEAALDDQIEGGTIVVEGEPSVIVEVKAADADAARRILDEDDALPAGPPTDS
jgi:hypothetical protein